MSTDLKKNVNQQTIKNALRKVPGAHKYGVKIRIAVTCAIVALCLCLLIPLKNKPDPLIAKMAAYSPASEAESFYAQEGPKAAYDFVSFYQSLPGAKASPELLAVKSRAEAERSSWSYLGKEVGLGLLGLGAHERYAQVAGALTGQIPYASDAREIAKYARELTREWENLQSGKGIDALHTGLAALGLTQAVVSLLPNDMPYIKSLQQTTNSLMEATRYMNGQLKDAILKYLDPIFNLIRKSGLEKIGDMSTGEILAFAEEKQSQLFAAMNEIEDKLDEFDKFGRLSQKSQLLSGVVAAASDNMAELEANSAVASDLNRINPNILLFGGPEALEAANRQIKSQGKISAGELEAAMVYGTAGLEAVGKLPVDKLGQYVKEGTTGSHFILPFFVIILIWIAAALIILRTWWREDKDAGAQPA